MRDSSLHLEVPAYSLRCIFGCTFGEGMADIEIKGTERPRVCTTSILSQAKKIDGMVV